MLRSAAFASDPASREKAGSQAKEGKFYAFGLPSVLVAREASSLRSFVSQLRGTL